MFNRKCGIDNHQFEGRYHANKGDISAKRISVEMAEILTRGDYVHDICVKCGKIVNFKERGSHDK